MSLPQLPDELEGFVRQEVAAGKYASKEDLFCQAVGLLHEFENRQRALREHVQTGIDQLDRGEGIILESDDALRLFLEDVQARGWQRYHARAERQ